MEGRKQGPVFVKLDEYKEITEVVELLRGKIAETKQLIQKINEVKSEEDAELELWKTELDELEKRVASIDRSLLEPRGV
jgi:uncharacterized coiled-coil protein SlyX